MNPGKRSHVVRKVPQVVVDVRDETKAARDISQVANNEVVQISIGRAGNALPMRRE